MRVIFLRMTRLVRHDRRLLARHPSIVGIDEAGRGCLAGPVSAAAVWFDMGFFADRRRSRLANHADDSKKLDALEREVLCEAVFRWRDAGALRVAQAFASVVEIDAYNILGATRLAMHRCVMELAEGVAAGTGFGGAAGGTCPFAGAATGGADTPLFGRDETASPLLLVDGLPLCPFGWRHEALVGGDGRSLAIALASIVAKTLRDRRMRELDALHPGYGFATHKGYATREHVDALRRLGPCAEHRPLFLRKILAVAPDCKAVQGELALAL